MARETKRKVNAIRVDFETYVQISNYRRNFTRGSWFDEGHEILIVDHNTCASPEEPVIVAALTMRVTCGNPSGGIFAHRVTVGTHN